MKYKKKMFVVSASALVALQLMSSGIVSASTKLGNQVNFSAVPMSSSGGVTYDMNNADSANTSYSAAYNDVWNNVPSPQKYYQEWQDNGYVVDPNSSTKDLFVPDTTNWDGVYNYGYYPVTTSYNIPINTLRNITNDWISQGFVAGEGDTGAYTMIHPDCFLNVGTASDGSRNMMINDFFFGSRDSNAFNGLNSHSGTLPGFGPSDPNSFSNLLNMTGITNLPNYVVQYNDPNITNLLNNYGWDLQGLPIFSPGTGDWDSLAGGSGGMTPVVPGSGTGGSETGSGGSGTGTGGSGTGSGGSGTGTGGSGTGSGTGTGGTGTGSGGSGTGTGGTGTDGTDAGGSSPRGNGSDYGSGSGFFFPNLPSLVGNNRFQLGDDSYNSISEMYARATNEQRILIDNMLREALEKMKQYSTTDIDTMINNMHTEAFNFLSGTPITPLTPGIFSGATFNYDDIIGSVSDPTDQLHRMWEQISNPNGKDAFGNANVTPYVTVPTTTGTTTGNHGVLNFDYVPGSADPSASGIPKDENYILKTYIATHPGETNMNVQNFSGEIIKGGVFDTTYMHHRLNLVNHVLDTYNNMGAQTIGLTKVIDYRITSFWIGVAEKYEPTGEYVWYVEKMDNDACYTAINAPGTMTKVHTLNYSFRPTSTGKYRITCYPIYTISTTNKLSAYATEYTFINDTRNVVFSEQYVCHGDSREAIEIQEETNVVTHDYNAELSDDPSVKYKNKAFNDLINHGESLEGNYVWNIDVTDAMVDNIIDFRNGTITSDFDTERVK